MPNASVHSLLQLLSLLCCLGVLVRLIQIKLFRIYPFFVFYFVLPLSLQIITVLYGICSRQLCLAFPPLESVRNVSYIVVVLELVSTLFRDRADLHPLRLPAVGIAGISSVGLELIFVAPGSHLFQGTILSIVRLERGITASLAIFSILFLSLTWKHAIKLPRNGVVLFIFWTIWFLGDSAMLMAATMLPARSSLIVNDGLALFEISSYLGWALLCEASQKHDFPHTTLTACHSGPFA
jgi:hypothetical protein